MCIDIAASVAVDLDQINRNRNSIDHEVLSVCSSRPEIAKYLKRIRNQHIITEFSFAGNGSLSFEKNGKLSNKGQYRYRVGYTETASGDQNEFYYLF